MGEGERRKQEIVRIWELPRGGRWFRGGDMRKVRSQDMLPLPGVFCFFACLFVYIPIFSPNGIQSSLSPPSSQTTILWGRPVQAESLSPVQDHPASFRGRRWELHTQVSKDPSTTLHPLHRAASPTFPPSLRVPDASGRHFQIIIVSERAWLMFSVIGVYCPDTFRNRNFQNNNNTSNI